MKIPDELVVGKVKIKNKMHRLLKLDSSDYSWMASVGLTFVPGEHVASLEDENTCYDEFFGITYSDVLKVGEDCSISFIHVSGKGECSWAEPVIPQFLMWYNQHIEEEVGADFVRQAFQGESCYYYHREKKKLQFSRKDKGHLIDMHSSFKSWAVLTLVQNAGFDYKDFQVYENAKWFDIDWSVLKQQHYLENGIFRFNWRENV